MTNALTPPCVFMGGRNSCLCLSSVWKQKEMLESLPAVTGTEEGLNDGRDTLTPRSDLDHPELASQELFLSLVHGNQHLDGPWTI